MTTKKRGKGCTDIQLLFMVFLRGLGYTEKEIGCTFGVSRQCISSCIKRGKSKINNGILEKKGCNPAYSKREVSLLYVGSTSELELIDAIKHI